MLVLGGADEDSSPALIQEYCYLLNKDTDQGQQGTSHSGKRDTKQLHIYIVTTSKPVTEIWVTQQRNPTTENCSKGWRNRAHVT